MPDLCRPESGVQPYLLAQPPSDSQTHKYPGDEDADDVNDEDAESEDVRTRSKMRIRTIDR